jgi:hypothetical protein
VQASLATHSQRAARHGYRRLPLYIIEADTAPNDALINTEMATNSLGLVTTDTPIFPLLLHKVHNDIIQSFKFIGALEA